MLMFECKNQRTDFSFIAMGDTVEDVKKDAEIHVQTGHNYLLAKMPQQQIDDMTNTIICLAHRSSWQGEIGF